MLDVHPVDRSGVHVGLDWGGAFELRMLVDGNGVGVSDVNQAGL